MGSGTRPLGRCTFRSRRGVVRCLVLSFLISGCSSSAATSRSTLAASTNASEQATAAPSTVVRKKCPNPDAGPRNKCRGPLDAGQYTTTELQPSLTFSVPGVGWLNTEDETGQFLLIPPGGSQAGVDAGTADFIGVYSSVAAPFGCLEEPDPAVATTVQAYLEWLQHQPSLVATAPRPVTVGGLTGVQVDVSMSTTAKVCSAPNIPAFAPTIIGTGETHLTHAVDPPQRLYLFDHSGKILVIEIDDAPHGGSQFDDWWAEAAQITKTFHFGT